MTSIDPTIATTIATSISGKTTQDALHTTYAINSQTRILSLCDRLRKLAKYRSPLTEY